MRRGTVGGLIVAAIVILVVGIAGCTSLNGSPTPSDERRVRAECGQIDRADVCARTIELARFGHEAEVAGAIRIVVDDTCSPGSLCDRQYSFDAVVVFVGPASDETEWYAAHVYGRGSEPTTAEPWRGELPFHVVQRLREPPPAS